MKKKRKKKRNEKRKRKNNEYVDESVNGVSWGWLKLVQLEVEWVKDASTSLLEVAACRSLGRTFCKCWECNLSHRALLLTAMRSVVPLLCVI